MRSLRSKCEVCRKDRCRNSDVTERCGLKEDVVTRVEGDMSRWFGHLERMNERRLTRQIYRANVCDEKEPMALKDLEPGAQSGKGLATRGRAPGCADATRRGQAARPSPRAPDLHLR
ncbi:hypothetical protein EVAR_91423_1 [Eumeta japonica]|uniref:Uncharacterized protein n=1 Tax=Eumeta variegata TaxID=151549 RepID=A0A4C1WZG8_EUMVA|nr:hypothetical protein EVAR_91423_1 [Eumeta japonica]